MDRELLNKIERLVKDAGFGYANVDNRVYYTHVKALLDERAELVAKLNGLEARAAELADTLESVRLQAETSRRHASFAAGIDLGPDDRKEVEESANKAASLGHRTDSEGFAVDDKGNRVTIFGHPVVITDRQPTRQELRAERPGG